MFTHFIERIWATFRDSWQEVFDGSLAIMSIYFVVVQLLSHVQLLQAHGSSVHGILQARILEWVAIPFSRESSHPRYRTRVSYIGSWTLYWRVTGEAQWVVEECFLCFLRFHIFSCGLWGLCPFVMLDLNGASCQPIISTQSIIFLKNFEMAKRKTI